MGTKYKKDCIFAVVDKYENGSEDFYCSYGTPYTEGRVKRNCDNCIWYMSTNREEKEDGHFGCCDTCNKLEIKYREGQIDAKKKFLETMDQTAKADNGKPQLTLVPRQIIFDIAKIREYGVKKYDDPDNWKRVSIERFRDAAYRHFMAYLDDPYGVDEESGLPHLAHLACNIAFLCEMQKNSYTVHCADELKPMAKDMGDPGFVNGLVANPNPPSLTSKEEEAIDLELERLRRKTDE